MSDDKFKAQLEVVMTIERMASACLPGRDLPGLAQTFLTQQPHNFQAVLAGWDTALHAKLLEIAQVRKALAQLGVANGAQAILDEVEAKNSEQA